MHNRHECVPNLLLPSVTDGQRVGKRERETKNIEEKGHRSEKGKQEENADKDKE